MFNSILKSGLYPTSWQKSIIVPIHKNGAKSDPYNYRGVTISSCLSKLFKKVLRKNIDKHMEENKKWNCYQNGFKSECRTEDNISIINYVVSRYQNKNKKVYAAFVDCYKIFRQYKWRPVVVCIL